MDTPRIPGYNIIKPLGEGGMATVYLAIQENFQRKVAVKILSERLLSDASFCERFLREARIVAQLSHQHIVPVFDVGQHGDFHYIAMELLRGGDLKQRLEKGLPLAEGLEIVKQIAAALHYAASKNFVHRDIKPENILFREDGSAVVSDFGIARSTESETNMTLTGTIIGTPSYMSPEQAQALPLDGRSDLYSLGIILFEMLTGNVPFTADSAISIGLKHITEPIPELPEELSEFQELIDNAIAKDPQDRYQTGQQLIAALLDVERSLQTSGNSTTIISAADLKRHRNTTGKSRNIRRSGTSASRPRAISGRSRQVQPTGLMSRKGVLAASIVGIVAVAGLAGWWYNNNRGDEVGSGTSQAFNAKTQSLLTQAKLAVSENRLYEPLNHNAQYYYTTAIALAPGNQQAIEGIEALITTYLERSQAQLAAKNSQQAIEWLNRAAQIGFFANNQQLMERQQQIRLDVFQLQQQGIRLAENQRQVQALLDEGNKALSDNRLTSPTDNNAYDKFQSVLALDPTNSEAMKGIKAIAANYLDQAKEQVGSNNFVRARALVAAALQIDSQHPDLTAVQKIIADAEEMQRQQALVAAQQQAESEAQLLRQQEEAKRKRAEKINTMLAAAKSDLDNNRLQLPAGNNAVEKFRAVLVLEPSNLQALEGLQRVGEKYITLANDALKNQLIGDAQTYLNVAQKLVPNSQNLLVARRAILNAKEELAKRQDLQQQRERQISQLLASAKKDESAGRKSAPMGNNALEKYTQVLAINTNNSIAQQGRKKIISALVANAGKAIKNKQLDQADATLATLIRFVPDSSQTLALKSDLAKARKTLFEQQKTIADLLNTAKKLNRKSQSLANNNKLRLTYLKIAKLDPSNKVAKVGLTKISDYDIKLAKSSIKRRDYAKAKISVDRALKYTPSYAPALSVKKSLDQVLRTNKKLQTFIDNAEKEFARPGLLGNNDTAQQALKTAYQNIQLAKKLDSSYAPIGRAISNLEKNYVKAIKHFSDIKAFKRGVSLANDALAMDIPKDRINKELQLLDVKRKEHDKKEKKKKLTRQMGVF